MQVTFLYVCTLMNFARLILISLFLAATLGSFAQSKSKITDIVSGDYDEVKVSVDSSSRSFTIVDNSQDGNYSCTLFIKGQLVKNKDGKYPLKAYPYGFNNQSFDGTLYFRQGKNGHNGTIIVQLSESGSCQNMINYKDGVFLPLDKLYPYHRFSMVQSDKATTYADSAGTRAKGHLVQGDLVSVISDHKDYCYVEYLKPAYMEQVKKKPAFKAWIKKSDLIL